MQWILNKIHGEELKSCLKSYLSPVTVSSSLDICFLILSLCLCTAASLMASVLLSSVSDPQLPRVSAQHPSSRHPRNHYSVIPKGTAGWPTWGQVTSPGPPSGACLKARTSDQRRCGEPRGSRVPFCYTPVPTSHCRGGNPAQRQFCRERRSLGNIILSHDATGCRRPSSMGAHHSVRWACHGFPWTSLAQGRRRALHRVKVTRFRPPVFGSVPNLLLLLGQQTSRSSRHLTSGA